MASLQEQLLEAENEYRNYLDWYMEDGKVDKEEEAQLKRIEDLISRLRQAVMAEQEEEICADVPPAPAPPATPPPSTPAQQPTTQAPADNGMCMVDPAADVEGNWSTTDVDESGQPICVEPQAKVTWAGKPVVLQPGQWPEFYAKNVKPALDAVESKAKSIHGTCQDLEATNSDYWPLSNIINGVGGTSTKRPMELSSSLAAGLQIHTKDVDNHGQAGRIHECIAAFQAAVNAVNEGERALHQYYVAIGKGGEHTITGIKITAAIAVTAVSMGGGAATIPQAMGLAAAEGVAAEGTTVGLTALDPKQKVGWHDARAAVVSVLAKTLSAGASKGVENKLVQAEVGEILKNAGDKITGAVVNDLVALAGSVKTLKEFQTKAPDVVSKALAKGLVGTVGKSAGGDPGDAAASGATEMIE